MIFIKLLGEIVALFLLFALFRQAILKTFPVKAIGMPLSDQSILALKRFRNRFIVLFILCSALFTALVRYVVEYLFLEFHHRNGAIALIVDNMALLLPSLILGLLLGTFTARWLNHRLQKDGLSFFFEGYTDELKGFDRTQLNKWHIGLSLALTAFLLVGQYNYRIRINDGKLSVKTSVFGAAKPYALSDVRCAADTIHPDNYLIMLPDDTLYSNNFGGDHSEVQAAIKKAHVQE
jgi:glycerol uptake facilitator-like aquaporin